MLISLDQIKTRKLFIYSEILRSLTNEARENSIHTDVDTFIDVKLLLNGIECEPLFLEEIFNNLKKHIEREAEIILKTKYKLAQQKIDAINELLANTETGIKNATFN